MRITSFITLILLFPGTLVFAQNIFELAKSGTAAQVQAALGAGASADQRDADGQTLLMHAAAFNHNPEVISVLLAAGARIDARDNSGLSILMHAAGSCDIPAIVSALAGAGARIEERDSYADTPLMFAAARNMNPSILEALIAAGADVQARNKGGMTPLMIAGQFNGNPEVISVLVKAGARITDRNKEGDTSLHFAAANNRNPSMVSALVNAGAAVDEPDVFGRTALIAAAMYTRTPEVIQALLAAGADPKKKDNKGRTAFDHALENKSLDGTRARWELDVTHSMAKGLLIVQDRFYDIFPVFYGYYDTHSLGQVVIINTTDTPVRGARMSFFVREFMDAPRDCPVPAILQPGETATADLFAVFQPRILQVTENMKVGAEVTLEYTENGQPRKKVISRTFPILKRNALNWDDTRRAAAFVSPSDPAVLRFAKNVSAAVSGRTNPALDGNLAQGIAMHAALALFGLSYSQDPIPVLTPNRNVADFIQFPRQTLENRSGKCSDLSVLYSSLLEAVGVETAFITVPAHIYIAISLGMSEGEARKLFDNPDDLIFEDGKVWLPLELTLRDGDFLASWRRGAQEWRENSEKNQAALYPLHEAWKSYEPVALPGEGLPLNPPDAGEIARRVQDGIAGLITREISAREKALLARIEKDNGAPRPLNDLGVLYARFGLWEKAETQFIKALKKREYFPALLNMGNVSLARGDIKKALGFYRSASRKDPASISVLIGMMLSYEASGDTGAAKKVYEQIRAVDADRARQFADLENQGSTSRASNTDGLKKMPWEQE